MHVVMIAVSDITEFIIIFWRIFSNLSEKFELPDNVVIPKSIIKKPVIADED